MSSKIEVEWIAQAQGMNATLERINQKLDAQEKKLEQIGKTSQKAANAAAGSFSALQQELKDAEAALKGMAAGTAEFEKQRREVERLKNAVGDAKTQMQSVGKTSVAGTLTAMSSGFMAAANAGMHFASVLNDVREAQEEVIQKGAQVVSQVDEMARKMQVQLGLTDQQRQAETQRVLEAAKTAGVQPEAAFAAETQLSSSAFEKGVLDTILKIQQATNFEGNPQEVVQGIAQVLNAYQLERDDKNTKAIGASLVNLFRDTDLQMQDLGDFAKNASVFENAGIRIEQSLAAFSALRNIFQGSEAGTGMRNFVGILQTAAGKKTQTDALKDMGLRPQQVDFVGEDLPQVIRTLKDATDRMAPEQRQVAMGELFGRENIAVANVLLSMGDQVTKLEAIQGNTAALEQAAIVKRQSMDADVNRMNVELLQKQNEQADQIHELRLKYLDRENFLTQKQLEASIASPLQGAAASGAAYTTRLLTMLPGVSNESGFGASYQAMGGGVADLLSRLSGSIDESNRQNEETRKALMALNPNQQNNKQQNVRPQAAPLPAATVP